MTPVVSTVVSLIVEGDRSHRRYLTSKCLDTLFTALARLERGAASARRTYATRSELHDLLERTDRFGTHDLT